jgi:hypothetical protein
VEHEIGPKHVDDVGESPRYLLRHTRNYVEENFEADDEDEVYGPGTYCTGLCVSSGNLVELANPIYSPFALTHCEFKFGRADWSLICSKDSGGSW